MKFEVERKEEIGKNYYSTWEVEAENEEEAKALVLDGEGYVVDSFESDYCWAIENPKVTNVKLIKEDYEK